MVVRIDRVVTRGGDEGQTSLGDGTRVRKNDHRVEAYGTVDEANAVIGVLRALGTDARTDAALGRIQNDLFDVGADLCVPGEAGERLRLTDSPSAALEAEITALNAGLAPLRSFVLPGGTVAAAQAHVARTVTRRAERLVVALAETETVNPAVVRYLNRLSDYLFVLARHLNQPGGDVEWVPGANR
ncbi:MAG: cob(I)yrinic acid a,c-diamide adenosyltransferase [Acetobacteraceae bacterium]|nr:cob(I)yrinic acid a,c-diamide adenosyltransferase [Acetobacteraceae bacterium]